MPPPNPADQLFALSQTTTRAFGQEVDPQVLGKFLSDQAASLGEALSLVRKEKRELQAALLERDRALDRWSEVYQSVASILEGYYRLAGLKELADRIRPTHRRRRGEVTPEQSIADPNLSNPTDAPAPPTEPA